MAINVVSVRDLRPPAAPFATTRDAALHDCRNNGDEGPAGAFLMSVAGCQRVDQEADWGQVYNHKHEEDCRGAGVAR